jgi:hypothetical protein
MIVPALNSLILPSHHSLDLLCPYLPSLARNDGRLPRYMSSCSSPLESCYNRIDRSPGPLKEAGHEKKLYVTNARPTRGDLHDRRYGL